MGRYGLLFNNDNRLRLFSIPFPIGGPRVIQLDEIIPSRIVAEGR
jgi:hypothetical protein